MILAALAGSGLVAGLVLAARGLFPSPRSLTDRLGDFHRNARSDVSDREAIVSAWSRMTVAFLRAVRGELHDVERDLRVTGTTVDSYATDKLNAGIGGAVLLSVLPVLVGFGVSPMLLLLSAVVGFAGFYFVPDVELRDKAASQRREFDETVTAFVDLVAVSVAGGGGVNTAMIDAARLGDGWAFEQLRQTLADATIRAETPWAGFERLGRDLGVDSLVELAGAMSLAGTSGAKIRETLLARAESARSRELSGRLAEAERSSEAMGIPLAAMFFGWMGFLGYPTIMNLVGV